MIDLGRAEDKIAYKKFRADYKERYGKKLEWNEEPPASHLCTAGVPPASPVPQASLPARPTDEPYHLDPLDLMENRLATLVRDALDKELITVSRAAEILDVNIEEMRGRMKSWEVVK